MIFATLIAGFSALCAAELAPTPVFSVAEIVFTGPHQTAKDTPARDVQLEVTFRHESGAPPLNGQGFFDGDGKGGVEGNVFKVRFCPTQPGWWTLTDIASNKTELASQHRGDGLNATASKLHGFWLVDDESPQRRWYRRSDGSHQYIIGNTHYSFLSGTMANQQPSGNDIVADVKANARYFKKLRMGLQGDRYPHPAEKPFRDDQGQPTDDGNFSHRPNPRWFGQQVDLAVRTAFEADLVADLILTGPDEKSRARRCGRRATREIRSRT